MAVLLDKDREVNFTENGNYRVLLIAIDPAELLPTLVLTLRHMILSN